MKKFLVTILFVILFSGVALSKSSLPNCKGVDHTRWSNCYGEYFNLKLPNPYSKDIYTRNFKGEFGNIPGKRSGVGYSEVMKNGKLATICEMIFLNDEPIGYVECNSPNGLKTIELHTKGKEKGIAKIIYPEGDQYIGEINKKGFRHGKGLMTTVKGKQIIAMFSDGDLKEDLPLDKVMEFEEGILIIEANLNSRSKCKDLGFTLQTSKFENCNKKLFKDYLALANSQRIQRIKDYENSIKPKKQLFKNMSDGNDIVECISFTVTGACAKRIPYIKKKKILSNSTYSDNSYGSNNQVKLYYDPKSGGMRECNHDPGVTGKCLMFKPYSASSYDSNSLFYNPSNGSMQPCIGIITPLGKCTAFGLYKSGSASKGQLFYNSKEDKMTTCNHVTVSGKCAHYDIVAKNYSNNNSFKMSSSSNPYYKKVPRTNDQLISLGLNMLSGGCTLGLNC